MKKLLLVVVLTFFSFKNVNAQDIEFGVKGGLNFASIIGDGGASINHVTSFNFGVMAEIPISSKFSFQPELMYSGQGYKSGATNDLVALNYLNIPLMGKYYLTKRFSLEAGPQLGFLISADNNVKDTNIKRSFKTLDFGVNFGLAYKLDNGLNFSARYNEGLTNINDDYGNNKNGVFQISVGYFFF